MLKIVSTLVLLPPSVLDPSYSVSGAIPPASFLLPLQSFIRSWPTACLT
jgi:hypothetical protein